VLNDLPVQPRFQGETRQVGNLIRRHQPRAEAAGAGEGLSREVLAGVALPVAHAAVIVAGIARDGGEFESLQREVGRPFARDALRLCKGAGGEQRPQRGRGHWQSCSS
jgi:hypothetical protein